MSVQFTVRLGDDLVKWVESKVEEQDCLKTWMIAESARAARQAWKRFFFRDCI